VEYTEDIWNLADYSNSLEWRYPFINGHDMRQTSNIPYLVGLTAISLLVSSCSVDRDATKITAAQNVAA
jgi:hypothetical protein